MTSWQCRQLKITNGGPLQVTATVHGIGQAQKRQDRHTQFRFRRFSADDGAAVRLCRDTLISGPVQASFNNPSCASRNCGDFNSRSARHKRRMKPKGHGANLDSLHFAVLRADGPYRQARLAQNWLCQSSHRAHSGHCADDITTETTRAWRACSS